MSRESLLRGVVLALLVAVTASVAWFVFVDFMPTWMEYNEAKAWFIESCDWNPHRYDVLGRGGG